MTTLTQHLETPAPKALASGVRRGATWMLGARLSAQVLQFAGVLITARLLVPADYGKMAVVYPIIGFSIIFTNLGLGSALIHARELSDRLLATAFWLNALSGVAMTLLVAALSFPLSSLFSEPQLVPLLCLASTDFTLHVAVVQAALLERQLRFRTVAVIEVLGAVASFAAIVVGAALGWGAFALVSGPLADTLVTVTGFSLVVRYRPRGGIDRDSARQLWAHAKGVTGFQAVSFWARNADNLLLAGVVSQAALGNYNRAYNLMRLPIDQTVAIMSRVMFPALARLRDDQATLGRAWLRALSFATAITAPVALLLAVSAPSAVHVLLGPRWLDMVPVLELLALAALPQVISATSPGLLRATGQTGLLFRLGLCLGALSIVAMCLGLPWGTRGVATALLVKFCLDVPVVMHVCCQQAGLHWRDVVQTLRGVALASAALLAVGVLLRVLLEDVAPWEELVAQALLCTAAYLAVLALVDRRALRGLVSLGRRS